MLLVGANQSAKTRGTDALPGRVSYFIGSDPSNWHPHLPTFARVVTEDVYPGISLAFYAGQDGLEYDFTVSPGADPSRIRIAFEGFSHASIDRAGTLILSNGSAQVVHDKPFAYQNKRGERTEVASSFHLSAEGTLTFELGSYDPELPLTIDPVLTYSTYLGGADAELARAILVDQSGNAYICGDSRSSDFTHGSAANSDVFVGQVSSNGGVFSYSFFGGSSDDSATGLALDAFGNIYVCGTTRSGNYPRLNSINGGLNGESDAFVTKLTPTGDQFLYSTLIGGSGAETGVRMALDGDANAYVAGKTTSTDFFTLNAVQPAYGGGSSDAFVTKIAGDGSALVYSTYLGGEEAEDLHDQGSIVVDADGNAYITGDTSSPDFPTKQPLQLNKSGDTSTSDAFVSKIDSTGSDFIFSTYLGGEGDDNGAGLAIDSVDSVYLSGTTTSSSFPGSTATRSATNGSDAFVARLDAAGDAYTYLTFIGGPGDEAGNAIAVDAVGNCVVAGSAGDGLPTLNAVQTYFTGKHDVFVARLTPDGAIDFATYLGGSEEDAGLGIAIQATSIYVAGFTDSIDYPTSNVVHRLNAGSTDVFVSKIDPDLNQKAPVVLKVRKDGNQLSVFGQNFKHGAVIFLNERPKATHAGSDPTQILISTKGAKKIKPGRTVQIQVENPNGKRSNFFFYTAPVS
jgi:hypothetical protein